MLENLNRIILRKLYHETAQFQCVFLDLMLQYLKTKALDIDDLSQNEEITY